MSRWIHTLCLWKASTSRGIPNGTPCSHSNMDTSFTNFLDGWRLVCRQCQGGVNITYACADVAPIAYIKLLQWTACHVHHAQIEKCTFVRRFCFKENWQFFSWCFGMAWKRNSFETQIVQCSKDKSKGNHPRDPARREIHYTDETFLKEQLHLWMHRWRKSNRIRWGDNGGIFIPGAPRNPLLRTYSAKTCKNIEIQSAITRQE